MDKSNLEIPKPEHKYGYSYAQLETFLTKEELKKFNKWIWGQTCMADDNLKPIYYTWDVQRFVEQERKNIPTFWD